MGAPTRIAMSFAPPSATKRLPGTPPRCESRRPSHTLYNEDVASEQPEAESSTLPESLGPFRIRSVLGTGGSGIVYEAEWNGRDIALKVLRAETTPTPRVVEKFLEE